MIRAVIFDLDGTLLDTLGDLTDSVNHTFREYGYPEVEAADLRRCLGNGAHFLISHLLPAGTDEESVRKVQAAYEPWYQAHCTLRTGPYDGIMALLGGLKMHGVRCAIVSNKGDGAVKELARGFFGNLTQTAVGERPGIRRKPAPDTVLEAMRLLDAEPEETLYVGDSEVDYETARAAHIPCALVTWGFRDREQLQALGPEYLISRPGELEEIILRRPAQ